MVCLASTQHLHELRQITERIEGESGIAASIVVRTFQVVVAVPPPASITPFIEDDLTEKLIDLSKFHRPSPFMKS